MSWLSKRGWLSIVRSAKLTKWDRKQYYYPDLPKGYQISQYDLPFSSEGWLEIATDRQATPARRIGIIRAHLEEDAGKNLHDESGRGGDSLVDLNRAGTPLLEIVTKPDIRSGAEAHALSRRVEAAADLSRSLRLQHAGGKPALRRQRESARRRRRRQPIATPIVEVKNLNSFRGVEQAIEYEAERQFDVWKQTGKKLGEVSKETRGWDAERGVTFGQRGKEEASDYRYFPDPDLVPVTIEEVVARKSAPASAEFPAAKRQRLRSRAASFALRRVGDRRPGAGLRRLLRARGRGVRRRQAGGQLVDAGRAARDEGSPTHDRVVPDFRRRSRRPPAANRVIARSRPTAGGLCSPTLLERSVADKPLRRRTGSTRSSRRKRWRSRPGADELTPIIDAVLAANAKIVADVKGGKQQAIGALIGQVMKRPKGPIRRSCGRCWPAASRRCRANVGRNSPNRRFAMQSVTDIEPTEYAAQFRDRGFAVFPQLLSAVEVDRLRQAIESIPDCDAVRRKRNVYGVRNLLDLSPEICRLAALPAIRQLVTPILGEGAFAARALFFDKCRVPIGHSAGIKTA